MAWVGRRPVTAGFGGGGEVNSASWGNAAAGGVENLDPPDQSILMAVCQSYCTKSRSFAGVRSNSQQGSECVFAPTSTRI